MNVVGKGLPISRRHIHERLSVTTPEVELRRQPDTDSIPVTAADIRYDSSMDVIPALSYSSSVRCFPTVQCNSDYVQCDWRS